MAKNSPDKLARRRNVVFAIATCSSLKTSFDGHSKKLLILINFGHSPCKAPWSGTPYRTTSAHSKTMSPLDSAWKPGFSLVTAQRI